MSKGKILLKHKDKRQCFADFCDEWFNTHTMQWKVSSADKYRTILEKHIKPTFGQYRIEEFNSEVLCQFSTQLLQQFSSKTVRDILTLLHQILKNFYEANDAVLSVTMNYPKPEAKELRVLSQQEQKKFVHYLMQDMNLYKFSMLFALVTGLRIGEICGLRWRNISFEHGTVTVTHTVQRIKNSDINVKSKTILYLGTPKTACSTRTIPLSESILKLCKNFKKENPEVFILTDTLDLPEPRKLQRRLKKYVDDCQLMDVHFHTLRHTFARGVLRLDVMSKA